MKSMHAFAAGYPSFNPGLYLGPARYISRGVVHVAGMVISDNRLVLRNLTDDEAAIAAVLCSRAADVRVALRLAK